MATDTRTPAPVHAERLRSHAGRHVLGAILGISLLLGLLVAAFALPALRSAPHDLPVGVAGPPSATAPLSQLLAAHQTGAFAVSTYPDEAALRSAILNRDVYGGLAVSVGGPKLLVATAASPAVAAALTGVGEALGQSQGVALASDDVVSLPSADPHGVGLATVLLPMLVGGVAPVVILVQAARRRSTQVLGVLLTNLATGFTVTTVLHLWLGTLAGSYPIESLTMSLLLAAISTPLLGLYAVLRWPGFGLGVLALLLLGLPLSGVQSAPELLPAGWSTLGQALPPGAGGRLLRSVAYFDGHGATASVVVLTCWVAAGLLASWLSRRPGGGTRRLRRGRARRTPVGHHPPDRHHGLPGRRRGHGRVDLRARSRLAAERRGGRPPGTARSTPGLST